MDEPYRFIVYTAPYNPHSGGVIALHKLCDTLNRQGHSAKIWLKTEKKKFNLLKWPRRYIKKKLALKNKNKSGLNPNFITTLAAQSDIEKSIVIYAESVSDNPLNAKRVVRWLLFKPGFFTGEVEYGDDDLFFYFNEAFNDTAYNKTPGNKLHVTHILTDIYKQTNFGKRSGGCYIVRKGKNRDLTYHPDDYKQIDDLPHEEVVRIFNESSVFISYDFHTMYSQYAVLCGCKSIVVPDETLSKRDLYPAESNLYAVAYGRDEVEKAFTESEIKKLKEQYGEQEQLTHKSVANFVSVSIDFFAARAKK